MKRPVVAKDYMISNYNKKIELEDIASVACLSVNHLLRTFKQAYQTSPYQFLNKIRLERAVHHLTQTDVPITEVAGKVGFDCPSAFTRYFKIAHALTPFEYRRQHNSDFSSCITDLATKKLIYS